MNIKFYLNWGLHLHACVCVRAFLRACLCVCVGAPGAEGGPPEAVGSSQRGHPGQAEHAGPAD